MSTTLSALKVTPGVTSALVLERENLATQLQTQIGCDIFDVVHLEDGIDVFVDDEGLLVARPALNVALTVLAHQLGSQAVLFGTGIVLGGDDASGETLGLTEAQRERVLGAIMQKPSPEVLEKLCESLSPFPGVVQLLGLSA